VNPTSDILDRLAVSPGVSVDGRNVSFGERSLQCGRPQWAYSVEELGLMSLTRSSVDLSGTQP
jgi:hypothetical protein